MTDVSQHHCSSEEQRGGVERGQWVTVQLSRGRQWLGLRFGLQVLAGKMG